MLGTGSKKNLIRRVILNKVKNLMGLILRSFALLRMTPKETFSIAFQGLPFLIISRNFREGKEGFGEDFIRCYPVERAFFLKNSR